MERIHDFEKPPSVTLKRSLIIFFGNVIGLYLISFFGLGVTLNHFADIAVFVIYISIINEKNQKNCMYTPSCLSGSK